ncbi:MAG: hypothetical protein Q4E22_02480 [Coriobacteriia bacterium]|nr:hypothetical protein [Coriobacteriia bacterium]
MFQNAWTRKGVAILLASGLSLVLAACGSGSDAPDQPVASTTENPAQTSTVEAPESNDAAQTPEQNPEQAANPTEFDQSTVNSGTIDPNSDTALIGAEEGVASTKLPEANPNGRVHKNEALVFVVIGEYATQSEADKALQDAKKLLMDQKDEFYVLPTDSITGFEKGKFIVAEIYPSLEAVEGYDAVNFAQSVAPKDFKAYAQPGTLTTDQPVVVFGVDVQ